MDITCGERAADQRPVCIYEAQDTVHRDLVTDDGADGFDLLQDPVDQLGAVPAADDQALDPWAQEPASRAIGQIVCPSSVFTSP